MQSAEISHPERETHSNQLNLTLSHSGRHISRILGF